MSNLTNDFDNLVDTYKQLLQVCAEALAPGKTQEERNKVRDAIAEFLKDRDE